MKAIANQFSTEFVLASCAPTQGIGMNFGFVAGTVRVVNLAAVPIHYTFASTSPATTDDPELLPGKDLAFDSFATSVCGISTTSTTTSTGADGHRVRVSAYGV